MSSVRPSRATSSYSPLDERFIVTQNHWQAREPQRERESGGKSGEGEQYWRVYLQRLKSLKRIVTDASRKKWPSAQLCGKVSGLAEISDPDQKLVVIGTLIKTMQRKQRVLDLFSSDSKLESGPLVAAFGEAFSFSQQGPQHLKPLLWSPGDRLEIEDESARIQVVIRKPLSSSSASTANPLPAELDINTLVSGVVVGLCGTVQATGEFCAEDIVFAEPPEMHQPPKSLPAVPNSDRERWVAFVSDLNLAATTDILRTSLLLEYLTGMVGADEATALQTNIVHVVLAGGVFLAQTASAKQITAERLASVDVSLAELASCVGVDVMPSSADPSNLYAPQQPFNNSLFPLASRIPAFRPVTNPHVFCVDERQLLGESGDILASLRQASSNQDPLVFLESLLRWRHLAPIAPDLHPCYPLCESDPFLISRTPNIFFAGGADCYSSRLVHFPTASATESTLLLSIPSFDRTGVIVLVELGSLRCVPVQVAHPFPPSTTTTTSSSSSSSPTTTSSSSSPS